MLILSHCRTLITSTLAPVGLTIKRTKSINSFKATSRRQQLYAEHLEQLNAIAEQLTLASTIPEVMNQVAACAERLVGGQRVSYCEMAPDGQSIQLLGLVGSDKDQSGHVMTLEESGLGDIFTTGVGRYVSNLENATSAHGRALSSSGFNHVWSFPIVCGGTVEGVVNIASPEIELHPDDAFSVVETLSRLIGSTIERIKAREETQRVSHQLVKQSTTDPLTGLCNRAEFHRRLQASIDTAKACGETVGIMFLDLDLFKNINDTLGHSVGDDVLKVVAERIKATLEPAHTVARVGGDEFIIIVPGAESGSQLPLMALAIINSVKRPIPSELFELQIGASVGVCSFPADGDNVDDLVKNADIAMYRAKDLGRNQYHVYTTELGTELNKQVELSRTLSFAEQNNEFYLQFQPQIDITTGRIVALEALLRWEHPVEGNIPPDIFIPIAESSGLITSITSWVLENALAALAVWRQVQPDLRIAINVSAQEFSGNSRLVERVHSALYKYGLPADALELELTETAFLTHPDKAAELVHSLSSAGIKLAIDDFGTGYASLNYLIHMPIDTIKIDRSFVNELEQNPSKQAVINGIFTIAEEMQLACVGEGVETPGQLAWLQRNGCKYAQGFFISLPLSAHDVDHVLDKHYSMQLAA